ncbi:MAG: flippase-like domain-containing protein, partial [Chloroflexota bacterium]|nr:flippase-like domain-containing protein [Chloroflexota bacterium]
LDGVFSAVRQADVQLLLLAAPLYLVSLWVLAYRWHLLVRMADGVSHLPKAAEAFFTSVVINYAAPIGLAVPSRAALTKRALGLDAAQTGTIALWEIAFDLLVLACGAAIWLLIADGAPSAVRDEIAESSTSYLVAGVALVLLALAVVGIAIRRPGIRAKLASVGATIMLAPSKRPMAAGYTLFVTLLYWVMQGIVLWLLVMALGVSVSAPFMLGFTSIPILIGMLSPIPGGAAVREGLMYVVARLSGYGDESDAVLAAALIYRFALFAAIPILFSLNRLWLNSSGNPDMKSREIPADERI